MDTYMQFLIEINDDLVNLINVLIWPGVVLALFFTLRRSIVNLINRVKSAGYKDSKVEFFAQEGIKPKSDTSNVDTFLSQFSEDSNNYIKEKFNLLNVSDDLENVKKHLRANLLINEFSFIYYAIFGTQIKLLINLENVGSESYNDVKRYYDEGRANFPLTFPSSYAYEEYMNFLKLKNLIDIKDGRVSITNFGKDFLKYLKFNNILMIKLN